MTEQPNVVQALTAVMSEVQAVGKGGRNLQQGYNFRGIDAVVNAVGPALRKHGVVALPTVESVAYNVVEVGQKRTPMRECTVTVRYTFYGPAGDSIACVSIGEAMDSGDKSTPKAMSVAYRVALLQALCIPTDEPDADLAAYERAPAQPEWDPIEQDVYRTAFEAEIQDVKTDADLAAVSKRIQASSKAGEISPATWDHLSQAGAKKRAEMNGKKLAEEVKPDAVEQPKVPAQ